MAEASGTRRREAGMPFILVTVLLDMVAIGLIVPVLPLIVGRFTASPTEQTFWFGAVTFTFGVANFFASPILGALSDRYGRRPVLLVGFSGLALSFFVTANATALWMLVAVRLFSGAMQSNISIANAYVADITPAEDRARRFGLLGAMFGVGFILGPAMGGLLGAIDIHLPFFAAGTLAIANWLYGFFVLPESLPPERRRAFEWRRANPFAALRRLGALKGVGPLIAGGQAAQVIVSHIGTNPVTGRKMIAGELDALTFTPDEDGIIPVLDGEWFEDDIVARTRDFLRATLGLSLKTRGKTWSALADELWRYVLFSEFVFDLLVALPDTLKGVPHAPMEARPIVEDVCDRLRSDPKSRSLSA